MKKIILILLVLLVLVNVAYAERIEVNYSIRMQTYNGTPGETELFVDNMGSGRIYCDSSGYINQRYQIVRDVNCGAVQAGTVDTLAHDMGIFVDAFNDTKIYLFQKYQECEKSLSDCRYSNDFKAELLKDCNGTSSDWSGLYKESQTNLEACNRKSCFEQTYIDNIEKKAKDQRMWDIGGTATIVGLIAYVLYFRKGLAKMPYNEV